ncbi:glycosyl hydrolase family 65 protein [Streptomyces sp. BE20]|uniref:glycoside hydrolase family 65 protein n=1 Tax=unclassified Streptomyces TaxID=2593676 RepID=UPI002E75CD06|nr:MULTISPECIES: glycosyl hydrolase family 65 protein [unclassified Streptomyces]MED7947992.1 glycosyl hydrolase family 65 protein [Streptomyces sp. BE303]MEE1822894.1 glycosyl hydrolase family 65 protein [Streptomyces sp. BE20]
MTGQEQPFVVDPWQIAEQGLDLAAMARAESVFALSNGHIGLRANLDEGEPHGLPGTYLNGVFELRPLPYGEGGYGYPESSQSVINVTNGKIIRLLVDDEPFDLRYGELLNHRRWLDFREGLLRRSAEWTSPAGRTIRVESTRLVSLTQRAIAAVEYTVEAVDGPVRIVLQSELVANEQLPGGADGDPRAAAVLEAPLLAEVSHAGGTKAVLVHRTRYSGIRVAAGMDHVIEGPDRLDTVAESEDDHCRISVTTVLRPGERLRLVKFMSYGWSATRSQPAVRDQVEAALTAARYTGWDGLVAEQARFLEEFWDTSDIEIEGDVELQQAVRFAVFHVLQAGARSEERAIPAKGLTGPGYDGHSFWDTETFVLPVLTYCLPSAVNQALRWRHTTLPLARERAAQLGLAGAVFPWRTIRGEECSGYWPAGTAAFHIGADIAAAVARYARATGDVEFEREYGLELLVETARMWRSLGHHDAAGNFRIEGVTGPDEYSAVADNNVFTNLMAQTNLRAAAEAAARHPREASALGVDTEETAAWRDAAAAMFVPYDENLGVHPQADGFTDHQLWDFENTPAENYPLLLHYPYFDLYRKQVVKQADLVLAMQVRGDAFTDEQKARNFAYYERLTVRDSSLSACTQAVIASEVGQLDLAYDYTAEAALMDLHDLGGNTRDGLHMASLAGACVALVAGFGGLRDHGETLSFRPRLPSGLMRLSFSLLVRGQLLGVRIGHDETTYTLRRGEVIHLRHDGEAVQVKAGEPVSLPTTAPPAQERCSQPPGREPARRQPQAGVAGGRVGAAADHLAAE